MSAHNSAETEPDKMDFQTFECPCWHEVTKVKDELSR